MQEKDAIYYHDEFTRLLQKNIIDVQKLNIKKQWGNNWLRVPWDNHLANSINNKQENVFVSFAYIFL